MGLVNSRKSFVYGRMWKITMKAMRLFLIVVSLFYWVSLFAESSVEPRTVVAIVDSSGSMKGTDPKRLRIKALRMMLDTLGDETKFGVVEFDSDANVVITPELLGSLGSKVRQSGIKKVKRINASGETNINAGLKLALRLIGNNTQGVSFILMTDGKDKSFDGKVSYLPKDVKVHSIALSDKADREGLSKISAATGGVGEIAKDSTDLQRIFTNLYGEAEGNEEILVRSGVLKTGEQQTYIFPVESGLGGIDLLCTWPGSDIDLIVINPLGDQIDTAGAVRKGIGVEADAYDVIRLDKPASGEWKVILKGVHLAAQGEPFNLRVRALTPKVRARWNTNVAVPEVGQTFTVNVSGEDGVQWDKADIILWGPDNKKIVESRNFVGIASVLGGKSGLSVYDIRPKHKGIYRMHIMVHGNTTSGDAIMRTLDRTFRVAAPGKGVSYPNEIDPFIRHAPNELR